MTREVTLPVFDSVFYEITALLLAALGQRYFA